jgi:flagellar P-ring protein precursor FlgI
MHTLRTSLLLSTSLLVPMLPMLNGHALAQPTRLKDLVDVRGSRDNFLYGYGLVTGLSGTGDTERVLFTTQAVSSMLGRLGVRVLPQDVRMRNVAGVMVTARLPAYARPGTPMDVSVGSLGNARSLVGGVLLATSLQGPDGKVHALAQGEVQVGGFDVAALGSVVRRNSVASGRVPGGGIVELSVTPPLEGGVLTLNLRRPDATTSWRIAEAINQSLGRPAARALDPAAVEVTADGQDAGAAMLLLSRIEPLPVEADSRARVIISERTGTVVAGSDVHIRAVAVAHGGLQVSIQQGAVVSQPGAFSGGQTVTVPVAGVQAQEQKSPAVALPATTSVAELVAALNTLGATPRDLVFILQAIHAAGALDAELQVL